MDISKPAKFEKRDCTSFERFQPLFHIFLRLFPFLKFLHLYLLSKLLSFPFLPFYFAFLDAGAFV